MCKGSPGMEWLRALSFDSPCEPLMHLPPPLLGVCSKCPGMFSAQMCQDYECLMPAWCSYIGAPMVLNLKGWVQKSPAV